MTWNDQYIQTSEARVEKEKTLRYFLFQQWIVLSCRDTLRHVEWFAFPASPCLSKSFPFHVLQHGSSLLSLLTPRAHLAVAYELVGRSFVSNTRMREKKERGGALCVSNSSGHDEGPLFYIYIRRALFFFDDQHFFLRDSSSTSLQYLFFL